MEHSFIQHALPKDPLSMSDVDGLNLNITIPLERHYQSSSSRKLPVFVFIHGGGFGIGANSWPQYNLSRIVKFSAEKGLPVIGINIKWAYLTPHECDR